MAELPVIFTIRKDERYIHIATEQMGFGLFNRIVTKEIIFDVLEWITTKINNEYNRPVLFEYEP